MHRIGWFGLGVGLKYIKWILTEMISVQIEPIKRDES